MQVVQKNKMLIECAVARSTWTSQQNKNKQVLEDQIENGIWMIALA